MSNTKKAKPANIKDMLKAAKLPEKQVPICLRGDLQAEFEDAERRLTDAENNTGDSLAGNGARAVAEQIEALRQQMQEHTVPFRLRALPRPAWKDLLAAHPPRKGDDGAVDERDKYVGVNLDTFFEALVRSAVVEPQMDDEDWAMLFGEALTDRQFDLLSDAAWGLNRREVDVPFSRAALRILGSASE